MAIAFSFGLSVELVPDILKQMPEIIRNIFTSGITTGGVAAILANILIQIKEEKVEDGQSAVSAPAAAHPDTKSTTANNTKRI